MSAVAFHMAAHCTLDSAPLLSTAFQHAPGRSLGFLPPRYSSWEVGGVVSCPFTHEQGKHSNVISDHELGASYATFQALFLLVGTTDKSLQKRQEVETITQEGVGGFLQLCPARRRPPPGSPALS